MRSHSIIVQLFIVLLICDMCILCGVDCVCVGLFGRLCGHPSPGGLACFVSDVASRGIASADLVINALCVVCGPRSWIMLILGWVLILGSLAVHVLFSPFETHL